MSAGRDWGHVSSLTLDARRLLGDERVAHVLRDSGVGARREDPRAGRLGGLQQPLAQTPLDPGLQLEVGLAAAHRDQQLRLLQAPLAQQKSQHQFGLRVKRQTNVLGDKTTTKIKCSLLPRRKEKAKMCHRQQHQ